jgi:hypothetical protein
MWRLFKLTDYYAPRWSIVQANHKPDRKIPKPKAEHRLILRLAMRATICQADAPMRQTLLSVKIYGVK